MHRRQTADYETSKLAVALYPTAMRKEADGKTTYHARPLFRNNLTMENIANDIAFQSWRIKIVTQYVKSTVPCRESKSQIFCNTFFADFWQLNTFDHAKTVNTNIFEFQKTFVLIGNTGKLLVKKKNGKRESMSFLIGKI